MKKKTLSLMLLANVLGGVQALAQAEVAEKPTTKKVEPIQNTDTTAPTDKSATPKVPQHTGDSTTDNSSTSPSLTTNQKTTNTQPAPGATTTAALQKLETTAPNKFHFQLGDKQLEVKFLTNHLFRLQVITANQTFRELADIPESQYISRQIDPETGKNKILTTKNELARIVAKPDSEYDTITATFTENDQEYILSTTDLKVFLDKSDGKLRVEYQGKTVLKETQPIDIQNQEMVQTLTQDSNEYFFGGGMQNGRFSHKGTKIQIENQNKWTNGYVTSPAPLFYSTNGYGVLYNTFRRGEYDFRGDKVVAKHHEGRYDAYFFVGATPKELIRQYVELTGKPQLLPEHAYYLSHLNCYNRDYFVKSNSKTHVKLQGQYYREYQGKDKVPVDKLNEAVMESLMPEEGQDNEKFTAKHQIDEYANHDMPLGWFLPNDGYACGYGKDEKDLDKNIENLKNFKDYAQEKGVATGLWTQSDLKLTSPDISARLQRDFAKEVQKAGITSLKTDVAWVGPGYAFGLNGLAEAQKEFDKSELKTHFISLDGWAGTQRYGGIWSGDQEGGNFEYIRFHIPTLITAGLSGSHSGSDMDGIFGGSELISTRDYQWKAFTTYMLNMDGWGRHPKNPWYFGERYQSIARAYLKLKAELMPYTNTFAHEATETGTPILRAMMLEYPNEFTYDKEFTKYQYLWGDQFLIAPVYQKTKEDMVEDPTAARFGDDIRHGIYLPTKEGEETIWIDYLTGQPYRGGQVLNNFDAPLYKLPLFVKNGAIIPRWSENNNPEAPTATNPKGLDRSHRIIEFFPHGRSTFTTIEDDGKYKESSILKTHITSEVTNGTATLTIDKATYEAQKYPVIKEKSSEFWVHLRQKPTAVTVQANGQAVSLKEVHSYQEYLQSKEPVYFYDPAPQSFINKYDYIQDESKKLPQLTTTPQLYVKLPHKQDVTQNQLTVTIQGYTAQPLTPEKDSNQPAPQNFKDAHVTHKSIDLTWDRVDQAISYDIEFNKMLYRNILDNQFTFDNLEMNREYQFRVRAVTEAGNSNFSNLLKVRTSDNPYVNVVQGVTAVANVGDQRGTPMSNLFDGNLDSTWHTDWKKHNFNELLVDLKKVYNLDKIEYYPRVGGSNGTFRSGEVFGSIDKVRWERLEFKNGYGFNNYGDANPLVMELAATEGQKNRYRFLKFVISEATGGFGSGNELMVYAKDPIERNSWIIGDANRSGKLEEGDLQQLREYAGVDSALGDQEFAAQVSEIDVNNNGRNDAADVAFVTRLWNGGYKKVDKLDIYQNVYGFIKPESSVQEVQAQAEFEVEVKAVDFHNVNGFSFALDLEKYDLVSVTKGDLIKDIKLLSDFSKQRTHANGKTLYHAIFANLGLEEANIINGNGTLLKFKLRAKTAHTVDLKLEKALVVAQNLRDFDATYQEERVQAAHDQSNRFVLNEEHDQHPSFSLANNYEYHFSKFNGLLISQLAPEKETTLRTQLQTKLQETAMTTFGQSLEQLRNPEIQFFDFNYVSLLTSNAQKLEQPLTIRYKLSPQQATPGKQFAVYHFLANGQIETLPTEVNLAKGYFQFTAKSLSPFALVTVDAPQQVTTTPSLHTSSSTVALPTTISETPTGELLELTTSSIPQLEARYFGSHNQYSPQQLKLQVTDKAQAQPNKTQVRRVLGNSTIQSVLATYDISIFNKESGKTIEDLGQDYLQITLPQPHGFDALNPQYAILHEHQGTLRKMVPNVDYRVENKQLILQFSKFSHVYLVKLNQTPSKAQVPTAISQPEHLYHLLAASLMCTFTKKKKSQ